MTEDMRIFRRYLMDELGLYSTVPDSGSNHVELSFRFVIDNEAFENFSVEQMKLLLINKLTKCKEQFDRDFSRGLEFVKNYEVK